MRSLLALSVVLCFSACPTPIPRNYLKPSPEQLLAHVAGIQERIKTLNAETRSDSWVGGERLRTKVFMLAAWGGRLRFMVMAPNDTAAADLASDGQTYCYVDVRQNCGECGPATAQSVARLTRVVLEPDAIVAALFGSTQVLKNASVSAHSWDSEDGREVLILTDGAFKQRIELDGRHKRWDVVKVVMTGPNGKTAWSIRHFDFRSIKTADGGTVRFPATSQIKQGKTDLGIKWRDVRLNQKLAPTKFQMKEMPPGLPLCK